MRRSGMLLFLTGMLAMNADGLGQEAEAFGVRIRAEIAGELPHTTTSFGATVHEGHLYVYGGAQGRPHHYDRHSQTPMLLRRALSGGAFEALPSREALQGVALVSHASGLYRVGGVHSDNEPGTKAEMHSTAAIARYDFAGERWREVAALPEARSSHDAVVLKDALFVLGGWTLAGSKAEPQWAADLLEFRFEGLDLSLRRRVPLPGPRRAFTAVAHAGRIFLIGGIDSDGNMVSRVDVFDPSRGEFLSCPDFAGDPFGAGAGSLGDRLVANGVDGQLWSIGPDLGSWRAEGRLAFGRMFHRMVPDSAESLVVVGGIGRSGRMRHVERLALGDNKPVVARFELPFAGRARNRYGAVLDGSSLWFFGGNDSREQHDFDRKHFLSEGFELDLLTMRIKPAPDFPVARQSMMGHRLDRGRLLFAGGFGPGEDGVARSQQSAYIFDVAEKRWTELPSLLPEPRTQARFERVASTLTLFGGLEYDPALPQAESFNHLGHSLEWALKGEEIAGRTTLKMEHPRRAFSSATVGEKTYLVGGMRENFQLVKECEIFDHKAKTFHPMASPKAPRLNAEMIALGGRLYLLGGSVPGPGRALEPATEIEVYDPESNSWSTLDQKLPLEPRHMRAFAYEGRILVMTLHEEPKGRLRLALIDPGHTSKELPRPHAATGHAKAR